MIMGVRGSRKGLKKSNTYQEPDLLVSVDDILKKAEKAGLYTENALHIEDLISTFGDIEIKYEAMDAAKDMPLPVLDYLKFTPVNVAQEDKYPYDLPSAWPYLQYLPEALKDAKFYLINKNASSSYEKALNDNYLKICNIIRSSNIREVKKKHSK